MADDLREPRRHKLPREYSDDETAAAKRLGSSGRRPERDAYVAWRDRMLRDEQDNLALRQRLLLEKAEVLRARAGEQETQARERLTSTCRRFASTYPSGCIAGRSTCPSPTKRA